MECLSHFLAVPVLCILLKPELDIYRKISYCSRFGKFVEIQFNHMGRISGAAIRTYLLERSRVCQVSDPERNYHCFYMLCSAPEQVNMVHWVEHMKPLYVQCLSLYEISY